MLYSTWFCISKLKHLSMTWKRCSRDGRVFQQWFTEVLNTKPNTILFILLTVTFLMYSRIAQILSSVCSRIQTCYPRSSGSFCWDWSAAMQAWTLMGSPGAAPLFRCSACTSLCPLCEAVQWQNAPWSFCLLLLFLSLCCQDPYSAKLVFYLIYILHYKFFFFHLFCVLCVVVRIFVSVFTFLCSVLQFWFVSSRLGVLWGFLFQVFCLFVFKVSCYLFLLNNFFLEWST